MERYIGVEEARSRLGRLVDEVAEGAPAVVLARRGRARAVLVSREEYARFKVAATERARVELASRLNLVRDTVAKNGLDPSLVDQAIAAARRMR